MISADNDLDYVEKACFELHDLMAKNKKNMLENINRINRGELFVLHFLSMQKVAMIPSEISVALDASTARISALLGVLEKKEQIKRDIDINDRRSILVTLTEAGHLRVETEIVKLKENMTHIFAEMGKKDAMEFIRLTKWFFELSQKHLLNDQEEEILG